jgi:hypothetical protein
LSEDNEEMPEAWRWDQGRLGYFNFNNIKLIASALLKLDGFELRNINGDPLRTEIENRTGLPFLPRDANYPVWRNYARVFKLQLLAADIDKRLVVTDVCRKIAASTDDAWDVDTYISFLVSRFYYPSPALSNYDPNSAQIFPFCAIIKYLVAKHRLNGDASISLEQVFSFIIGNQCSGREDESYYLGLQPTSYQPQTSDERRITR